MVGRIGLVGIDTANPSSWTTAKDKVLAHAKSDVICLQETKIARDNQIADAKRHARGLGWSTSHSAAKRTAAQGVSGGCAVAARKGIGICQHPDGHVAPDRQRRVNHAWVNGIIRGGAHVFSVYAKDGIGPVGENLQRLEELAAAIRSISGPCIVAGDWNMTPHTLAQTG